jgi:alpha-tubulin suppressor-like RCC1 family protein
MGRCGPGGSNNLSQLGEGTQTNRAVPTQVAGLTNVVAVAAGVNHSLALTSDGYVWAWGGNTDGQIGDGSNTRRATPVLLGLTNIIAIAAGQSHSVALQSDGTVWTWGDNFYGQLGIGTNTDSTTPVYLATLTNATAIAAGDNYTLVAKSDGTAWAWGDNGHGQLGNGGTTNANAPVQMTGVSGAVALAAGTSHSLVLINDGTVRAVGYGQWGQLGNGSYAQQTTAVTVSGLTGVTAIAAGKDTSGARKSDGTILLWGDNSSYQLANTGYSNRWQPTAPTGTPASIARLAIGYAAVVCATSDGVVWTWSTNLGDGTSSNRSDPAFISETNYNWLVGTPVFNTGTGSFTYFNPTSVTITEATPGATIHYTLTGDEPTEADATVASGGSVSIDRIRTLKARAFKTGMPASRIPTSVYMLQAWQPTLTPGPSTYTSPQSVTMTTTTSGATIRYTTDGSIPTETSTAYSGPVAVTTTTNLRAAAFKTDWAMSAWYGGTYQMNFGTLAVPTATPAAGTYPTSVTVSLSAAAGATIRYTTNGSTPTTASPIYTGPFALTATTTVKALAMHPDYVTSGVLTAVYTINVEAPTFSPAAGTYAAGQLITIATATPGATIHYTLNGVDPTASDPTIASGGTITAGNFTLKAAAWKTGATTSAISAAAYALSGDATSYRIPAGDNHVLALRADGTVWAWGQGGQIGDGTLTGNRLLPVMTGGLTGVSAVSAGGIHSAALTPAGVASLWGINTSGQLGDNTQNPRAWPGVLSTSTPVAQISAGATHTLALLTDGTLLAWGGNFNGQLGDGSKTMKLSPVAIPSLSNVTGHRRRRYVLAGAQE